MRLGPPREGDVPRILTIASLVGLAAANAMAQPAPPAEAWVVVRDPVKLERNVLWSPGTASVASLPDSWSQAVAGWHGRRIQVSATIAPYTELDRDVLRLKEPVRVGAKLRSQKVWIVKVEGDQATLEAEGGGPTLVHPLEALTVGEPARAGIKLAGQYKGTLDESAGPLGLANRALRLVSDHPRSRPFTIAELDLTVEVEGVETDGPDGKELFVEKVLRPGAPQEFTGTLSYKDDVLILEQRDGRKSAVIYRAELDPVIAALKKLPAAEVRAYLFPEEYVLLAVGFKVQHPTHGAVWARFMTGETIEGQTADKREVRFSLGELLGINQRISGR